MNIFISATDTDVGKSYVSKHLISEFLKLGKKVGYLKPFQSGIEEGILSDQKNIEEENPNIEAKTTYETKTPCAPYISAKIDNIKIETKKVKADLLELEKNNDVIIVEGSGGLYVPVDEKKLMIDVIKELNTPLLIVTRPNLGTINHTLMSIECAKNKDIEIVGVVISNYPENTKDPAVLSAKEMIENYSDTKVVDIIKKGQKDLLSLAKFLIER